MAHDAFISYSNQDKAVADAACATLERHKIRCWIAPRDVPAGQPWASALVNAIRSSRVMVLILSEGSNNSNQVVREVDEAVGNGIPILPLRIDNVEPSDQMRYYIKSIHWLDALSPPLERHLEHLADSVTALLSVGEREQPHAVVLRVEASTNKRLPLPVWAMALIVLAVVVIASGAGSWVISQMASPADRSVQTEADSSKELGETPTDLTSAPNSGIDWHPVSFLVPSPQSWDVTGDNRYTAIEQRDSDAYAWSMESYQGNIIVGLDLRSAVEALDLGWEDMQRQIPNQNSGCVIIYGDGTVQSFGSLVFCVDWDGYYLEKHNRYHDDEPLAFIPSNNRSDKVYSVTVEIIDDVASMYVNGEMVLSSFFDMEEIDRSGRIGLFRNSAEGEITFSNIQAKTPDGD